MSFIHMTGKEWCDTLSIDVREISLGFGTNNLFYTKKISKEEFLNRLSQCDVIKPEILTRREAAAMKQQLLKN